MTTCKVCQKPKKRIYKKTSPNGSRKYYEDEEGNPWMGRKCPDCTREWNNERMKLKRKLKKDLKKKNGTNKK